MRPRLWFLPLFLILCFSPSSAVMLDGLIPFSKLSAGDREEVEAIVHRPTLSREVKGLRFLSRQEVYEYLLNHPDFATDIARALKLSKYRIQKDGDRYLAQDYRDEEGTQARGIRGYFKIVYAGPAKRVFFLWGTYEKPLLTIRARAVLVLEHNHQVEGEESYVYNNLYGYVRIDHPLLNLVIRLLSPILGRAMDRRMERTLSLAAKVSEEAYRDPTAFLKKLEENPELPQEELAEFRQALCPGC